MSLIGHFKELRVYQLAFDAAMRIFEQSKQWPPEERYSLTDQVRRSSRSVCANIAEGWRKRRYPSHFASKLSDADAKVAETQNWLDFALACGYLQRDEVEDLWTVYSQVSRGLVGMMNHPESWCGPAGIIRESVAEYVTDPGQDGDGGRATN